LTSGGYAAWRARTNFHRLATDFAFHSWRESRGVTEVDAAEGSELLAALRQARIKAGLPPLAEPPAPEVIRRYTMERALPAEVARGSRGTVVFTAGPLSGEKFDLAPGGLMIGRDPGSVQIVIKDGRVSKKHAWIGERDGSIVIVDRGSTNGTYLNGARIQEAKVVPGDIITLSGAADFQILPA
jgi:hypothetical protein